MRLHLFLVFTLLLMGSSGRAQSFYNTAAIQKIELFFSPANWDYRLDTARLGSDGYIPARWVKINGVRYDSVGVKYKGNSSFDSTFLKNPLHIELDAYRMQDYKGYRDIKLSNAYDDPSMVREVLAYDILQNYMDCSKANFAQVYINGTYMGLYTNSEAVNKRFLASHFYSNSGTFVKGNPSLTPSPNVKSNLKYISGGDSSSYYNYYEMKSDYGWQQLQALCDSVSNRPGNVASILDVDRAAWMMAFNTLLVNLDSYNGAFAQNYYIYKDKTGRFNSIIWDLNMSFGGFPFLGNSNTSLGSLAVSGMQNLPLNSHATDVYWPLIKAIYDNPMYRRMYIAHIKTITSEFFSSGLYLSRYAAFKVVVDTAVQSDTRKTFTYSQFQNALTANVSVGSYSVPGIQTLMDARVAYLQSTTEFNYAAPSVSLVAAVNVSPAVNAAVSVTAQVTGAATVYLSYRFSKADKFTRTRMYDDGLHNDGSAGDNSYGADFTMAANRAQYYVYAENANAGVFSPPRAEHEFYELAALPDPVAGQVVINEFLAYNKSDVKNEFHASEAWIELYNSGSQAVNLDNCYMTDDYYNRSKYAFPPQTSIPAHGFLTLWADGANGYFSQLHSNFKLGKDGESILIGNGKDLVLDSISYGVQEADVSLGRCPDGSGSFAAMRLPSFGTYNCKVAIEENSLGGGDFSFYPNPAGSLVTVTSTEFHSIEVMDLNGRSLWTGHFDNSTEINVSHLAAGMYLLRCGNSVKKLVISKN